MMMQAPLMTVGPVVKADRRRNNKYQTPQLITSAELDENALECFYCVRTWPCCCWKRELAESTYLDVYTNGVEIGKPLCCCPCCTCCSQTSMGVHHHYDDVVVFNDTAVKGELCAPYPFCLVNNCDCCGEVLVMRGKCCGGARFFALGNQHTTCNWCPIIACCMPVSVMYGLAPGEANRIASVINDAVATYRSGQWLQEPRIAAASGAGGAVIQTQQVYIQSQPPVVMGQEAYAKPL